MDTTCLLGQHIVNAMFSEMINYGKCLKTHQKLHHTKIKYQLKHHPSKRKQQKQIRQNYNLNLTLNQKSNKRREQYLVTRCINKKVSEQKITKKQKNTLTLSSMITTTNSYVIPSRSLPIKQSVKTERIKNTSVEKFANKRLYTAASLKSPFHKIQLQRAKTPTHDRRKQISDGLNDVNEDVLGRSRNLAAYQNGRYNELKEYYANKYQSKPQTPFRNSFSNSERVKVERRKKNSYCAPQASDQVEIRNRVAGWENINKEVQQCPAEKNEYINN